MGSIDIKKIAEWIRNHYARSNSKEQVPAGSYQAPSFCLEKPEEHGFGYHAHLRYLHGGDYRRCGYLLTVDRGSIWCVKHGGSPLIDARSQASAIRRDVKDEVAKRILGKSSYVRLSPKDLESGNAFRLFMLGQNTNRQGNVDNK